MIDPEAITEAKRALGVSSRPAGKLPGSISTSSRRSSTSAAAPSPNAETGYSTCSRTFWERCDGAVQADGALLRGYDDLQALVHTQRAQVAELSEAKRVSKFRELQDRQTDNAPDAEITAGVVQPLPAFTLSLDGASPEPGPDTVVLRLQLDGREVVVPLSRRLLLQAGIGSFVEAFALGQQFDVLQHVAQRPNLTDRVTITSPAHLQEILVHLREQWHALVKTDNLLGPRFALAGVLNQISVVEALDRKSTRLNS